MRFTTLTKFYFILIVLVCSFVSNIAYAQSIPQDFGSLSDEQLSQYWEQAQSQGYTLDQLKTVAQLKGVSPTQIAELESRITSLNNGAVDLQGQQINNLLGVSDATPVGFVNNVVTKEASKSIVFGMDFFNNPNISFTPNLNVATPDNYQLGPGDELVINLWGAAENSYTVKVNKEGVLRLPNIGPVFVNGMTIKNAKEVIFSKLKRVYGGISAPDNSPYKVFANVSLSEVRSIQVNLIGEVKVPGTYTLTSLSTVLNALYAAGGPTTNGTFREVKVIRNGQHLVDFDVYEYLINGSQEGNITLRDNDLIIVNPYLSRVSINGSVRRSGDYELKPDENFSDLLNLVSGFKANAYKEQFKITRIEGDGLVLKEITYTNILNEKLQNGDIIEITSIIDQVENSVSIEGPLFRPGRFEYEEGLSLKRLIEKASGITKEAYLKRGLIYRGDNLSARTAIPFSLEKVLDETINITLQNQDEVKLFNKQFLNFKEELFVSGGVREPGTFNYYENLTVEDLVLMAGGLTDGANPNIVDIYRKIKDDDFETLTESFKISLGGELDFSSTSGFQLQSGDRIFIRLLKGIVDSVSVTLEGELNYPGSYSANIKNEKISDFIEKAGGLSEYAFIEGATLIRLNPFYKEKVQVLTTDVVHENTADSLNLHNQKGFRVGIDLAKILKKPNDSKDNIVLVDGDRIVVPSIKSTVKTEGEVLLPSLIRVDNNLSFRDYINKSGGFGAEAKRRKSYVIYPNGDIRSTKQFLFFKNYPKILPGSIIIIPKKKNNPNPISTQEVIGLSSGFATLALILARLFD